MAMAECSQIGSSISCICWLARVLVYFDLEVTKITAFLLKLRELIKFGEVTETKPDALMSAF